MRLFRFNSRGAVLSAVLALTALCALAGDALAAVTYQWNIDYSLNAKGAGLTPPPHVITIKAAKKVFDDGSYIIYQYTGTNPAALTDLMIRARFDSAGNVYQEFRAIAGKRVAVLHANNGASNPTFWIRQDTGLPVDDATVDWTHRKSVYQGPYNASTGSPGARLLRTDIYAQKNGIEFVARVAHVDAQGRVTTRENFDLTTGGIRLRTQIVKYVYAGSTLLKTETTDFVYNGTTLFKETKSVYSASTDRFNPGRLLTTTITYHWGGNNQDGFFKEIYHTDHLNPFESYHRYVTEYPNAGTRSIREERTLEPGINQTTLLFYRKIDGVDKLLERDVIVTKPGPNGGTLHVSRKDETWTYAAGGEFERYRSTTFEYDDAGIQTGRKTADVYYDFVGNVYAPVQEHYFAYATVNGIESKTRETYRVTSYHPSPVICVSGTCGPRIKEQRTYFTNAADPTKSYHLETFHFSDGAIERSWKRTTPASNRVQIVESGYSRTDSFGETGNVISRTTKLYVAAFVGSDNPHGLGELLSTKAEAMEYYDDGTLKKNDVRYTDHRDPSKSYHRIYHYNADGSLNRIETVNDAQAARLAKPQAPAIDPILIQKNAVLAEKAGQDARIVAEDPKTETIKAPLIAK